MNYRKQIFFDSIMRKSLFTQDILSIEDLHASCTSQNKFMTHQTSFLGMFVSVLFPNL